MTRLEITRSLAAPTERVWHAWTAASELTRWFWPPSFAAEASVDLSVGGAWHIRSSVAGMGVSGVFTAIEAAKRLAFTWHWDGEDAETLVTVTFESEGSATLLTIVHDRFGDARAATDHEQGWNDCLDRLPAALD